MFASLITYGQLLVAAVIAMATTVGSYILVGMGMCFGWTTGSAAMKRAQARIDERKAKKAENRAEQLSHEYDAKLEQQVASAVAADGPSVTVHHRTAPAN
jgi:hypothetical protein